MDGISIITLGRRRSFSSKPRSAGEIRQHLAKTGPGSNPALAESLITVSRCPGLRGAADWRPGLGGRAFQSGGTGRGPSARGVIVD
jgi:hypothetical protein